MGQLCGWGTLSWFFFPGKNWFCPSILPQELHNWNWALMIFWKAGNGEMRISLHHRYAFHNLWWIDFPVLPKEFSFHSRSNKLTRKTYEVRLCPNNTLLKLWAKKNAGVWKGSERIFFGIFDLTKSIFKSIAEIINSHWMMVNITVYMYKKWLLFVLVGCHRSLHCFFLISSSCSSVWIM